MQRDLLGRFFAMLDQDEQTCFSVPVRRGSSRMLSSALQPRVSGTAEGHCQKLMGRLDAGTDPVAVDGAYQGRCSNMSFCWTTRPLMELALQPAHMHFTFGACLSLRCSSWQSQPRSHEANHDMGRVSRLSSWALTQKAGDLTDC